MSDCAHVQAWLGMRARVRGPAPTVCWQSRWGAQRTGPPRSCRPRWRPRRPQPTGRARHCWRAGTRPRMLSWPPCRCGRAGLHLSCPALMWHQKLPHWQGVVVCAHPQKCSVIFPADRVFSGAVHPSDTQKEPKPFTRYSLCFLQSAQPHVCRSTRQRCSWCCHGATQRAATPRAGRLPSPPV